MYFKKIGISAFTTVASLLLLAALAPQSYAQINSWNTDGSAAAQPPGAARSAAPQTAPLQSATTTQISTVPQVAEVKAQAPQTGIYPLPVCPSIEDATYQAAFGFNYPGANIKVFLSGGFAAELKGQYMNKVGVGGLRLYFYNGAPKKGDQLKFFWGVELDAITFKGKLSKGTGVAAEAFAGTEVFILKNVSLQADIGPAYINAKDRATSLNSNGLAFVVNSGINFYF